MSKPKFSALILLCLFVLSVALNLQLIQIGVCQIRLCNFRAWVYDAKTGEPIAGAVIELDWLPGGEFSPDYALTTGSDGKAERAVWAGQYNIRVRHSDYETYYEEGVYFPECGNWPTVEYFDKVFHLTPKYQPPSGHTLTFYLVDSQYRRVRRGSVILQGEEYRTDWEGKVIIYNVKAGTYTAAFKGEIRLDEWNSKTFDFQLTVNMPDRDVTYTVWVESQTIIEEEPPPEPNPPEPIPKPPFHTPEWWPSWLTFPMFFWMLFATFVIIVLWWFFGPPRRRE
ncbi:hypothetical protein DRO19_00540 [Candidatus Bathyarchaeota archaeon]|nr:MAG: hypothetical protein DRO19_00540 [Candidatus Bathyarchaeota archaeon]